MLLERCMIFVENIQKLQRFKHFPFESVSRIFQHNTENTGSQVIEKIRASYSFQVYGGMS